MAQIPIQMHFKISVKDPNALRNYFQKNKRLTPVRLSIETEYAERLEYGCGPYKNIKGADYDRLYKDLLDWTMKKDSKGGILPIEDEDEAKKFARALTNRIWNEQSYPHPYYRPAFKWMDMEKQRLWNQGMSIHEIVDETVRKMNQIIMDTNLPFKGTLQQSIRIRDLGTNEVYEFDPTNGRFRRDVLRKMADAQIPGGWNLQPGQKGYNGGKNP